MMNSHPAVLTFYGQSATLLIVIDTSTNTPKPQPWCQQTTSAVRNQTRRSFTLTSCFQSDDHNHTQDGAPPPWTLSLPLATIVEQSLHRGTPLHKGGKSRQARGSQLR